MGCDAWQMYSPSPLQQGGKLSEFSLQSGMCKRKHGLQLPVGTARVYQIGLL